MVFRFKQFSVEMLDNVFKVGTDASLLGALVRSDNDDRILDIGTGTGVLALMIAQRYPEATIDGIDIYPEAIELAKQNFDNTEFKNLQAILSDANTFQGDEKYDVIVSNPPYHLEGTHSQNSMKHRSKNHENMPMDDLIHCVEQNLSPTGSFWVIAPPSYIDLLSDKISSLELYPQDITYVKHQKNSKVSRMIVQYSRIRQKKENTLVLYKEHRVFSEQATAILSPYLIVL